MGLVRFGNNLNTSLDTGINDSVLIMDINPGDGVNMPSLSTGDWFLMTLNNAGGDIEIVKVTDVSTDTLTIVRGQEGTTPRSWLAGDSIENRLTVGSLESIANNEEDWIIVSNSDELGESLIRQDKNIFMKKGKYDLTSFGSIPLYSNLNLKGEKLPPNADYTGNETDGVYLIHANKLTSTTTLTNETFLSINPVTRGDKSLIITVGLTPSTVYEAGTFIIYESYIYVTKDEVTVTGGGAVTFNFTNSIVTSSAGITEIHLMLPSDQLNDINFENFCVCGGDFAIGGLNNSTFINMSGGAIAVGGGAISVYYSNDLYYKNIEGNNDYYWCSQCVDIVVDGVYGVEGYGVEISSHLDIRNVNDATCSIVLCYDFIYSNSNTDYSVWATSCHYFNVNRVHTSYINASAFDLDSSSNFTITGCSTVDQPTSFLDLAGATNYQIYGNGWQGTPLSSYSSSSNPAANNDGIDSAGIGIYFTVGDEWYNTTTTEIFKVEDVSTTTAIWNSVGKKDSYGELYIDEGSSKLPIDITVTNGTINGTKSTLFVDDASAFAVAGDITSSGTGVGTVDEIDLTNNIITVNVSSGTFIAAETIDNVNPYVGSEATISSVMVGSILDVRSINQSYFSVNETGQFQIDIEYEGLTNNPNRIALVGRYEGSGAHDVKMQAWNYSLVQWDDFTVETDDFVSTSTDELYEFSFPEDNSQYLGTGGDAGKVKVRVEHISGAIGSHNFYIDKIEVIEETLLLVNGGTDYKITNLSEGISTSGVIIDGTNGEITLDQVGDHEISANVSFIATPNTIIEGSIYLDDGVTPVKLANLKFRRKMNSSGDIGSANISGFFNGDIGDKISLRFSSDASGNFIGVETLNIHLKK